MKGDFPPVTRHSPGFRQSWFESLSLPIDANQNATGQVSNVLRGFIVHENRIESLRLTMQAETQFSAGLAARRSRKA
jgi:hypothetical protein